MTDTPTFQGGKGPAIGDPNDLRLRDYLTNTGADGGSSQILVNLHDTLDNIVHSIFGKHHNNTSHKKPKKKHKNTSKHESHKSHDESNGDDESDTDSDGVPEEFGLDDLPEHWGVQGNDDINDCVQAGFVHEVMLWTKKVTGTTTEFESAAAIDLYRKNTGWKPGDKSSDKGTFLVSAIRRRKEDGIDDKDGNTHKIKAHACLDTKDPDQLAQGTYMFGSVGVGVQFPQEWMTAFHDGGKVWDAVDKDDPKILFGHYFPVIGRKHNGNFVAVTWGKLQEMTPAGYKQFNDEAAVYFTEDYLDNGETPRGFDKTKIKHDIDKIGH